MATGTSRPHFTTDDLMAMLDDAEELDDCFAPGSDDELGFEDEENEKYIISHKHIHTKESILEILLSYHTKNKQ